MNLDDENGSTAMALPDRYQRQMTLPEVGPEGQQKLLSGSILVVGLGGLGLPAANYLAGAGVGRLTLVDGDVVNLHNLHRQVFFRQDDVGKAKADVAARHLRGLNGDITIHTLEARATSTNVAELVADSDVVLDAADNFATTYLLSDECKRQGKYLVSASLLGTRGYLGVFCGPENTTAPAAPSYRALFPTVPSDTTDCNSAGVLGTAVGTLGLMQAQEAIKLMVAPKQALVGKLLSADFWHNRFSTVDFRNAAEPTSVTAIRTLGKGDLQPDDKLVDVRSEQEALRDPVAGSLVLPCADDGYDFSRLPRHGGRTVFFCVSGNRASAAARQFAAHMNSTEAWVWLRE